MHCLCTTTVTTNPLLLGTLVLSQCLPSLSTILYYCILFYVHILLSSIVVTNPLLPGYLVLSHLLPSLSHHPLSCLPVLLKSTQLQASLLFDLTSELRCLCVYYVLPEKRKHVSHSNWSYLRHTRSCHQTKLSSAPSQLVSAGPSFVCPSLPPPPCPTKRSILHQYSSPLSEHLIWKI